MRHLKSWLSADGIGSQPLHLLATRICVEKGGQAMSISDPEHLSDQKQSCSRVCADPKHHTTISFIHLRLQLHSISHQPRTLMSVLCAFRSAAEHQPYILCIAAQHA